MPKFAWNCKFSEGILVLCLRKSFKLTRRRFYIDLRDTNSKKNVQKICSKKSFPKVVQSSEFSEGILCFFASENYSNLREKNFQWILGCCAETLIHWERKQVQKMRSPAPKKLPKNWICEILLKVVKNPRKIALWSIIRMPLELLKKFNPRMKKNFFLSKVAQSKQFRFSGTFVVARVTKFQPKKSPTNQLLITPAPLTFQQKSFPWNYKQLC